MALPYEIAGAFINPVFIIGAALAVTVIVMLSIDVSLGNKLRAAGQLPRS